MMQNLRHKTEQHCHKKTLIECGLLCANLTVCEDSNKTSGISGFYMKSGWGKKNVHT